MKYMMLIADSERQAARSGDEAVAAYQAIEAWWDGHAQAGRIVEGHELEPASTATTVHIGPDGDATIKARGARPVRGVRRPPDGLELTGNEVRSDGPSLCPVICKVLHHRTADVE